MTQNNHPLSPFFNKWMKNINKPLHQQLVKIRNLPNFNLNGKGLYFSDQGFYKIGSDGELQNVKLLRPNVVNDPNSNTLSSEHVSSSDNSTYFSKPNGKWVIIRDDGDNWGIYFNPLGQTGSSTYGMTDPQSRLRDYCKKVSSEDPICNCVPPSDDFKEDDMYTCVDNFIGEGTRIFLRKSNPQSLKDSALYCGCKSGICQDNEIFKKWILPKISTDGKCPSGNMTLCVAGIAGDEIKNKGNITFEQNCSGGNTTPGNDSDNSNDNNSDNSNDNNSDNSNDNNSDNSNDNNSDDQTGTNNINPSFFQNNKLPIIGGVIVLIILIIGIVYYFKNKSKN